MVYLSSGGKRVSSVLCTQSFYHHTSCLRQISYKSLLLRVGGGELSFHIFVEIPVTPTPPPSSEILNQGLF